MSAGSEQLTMPRLMICDSEKDYLLALTEFLRQREEIPWTIESYSGVKELRNAAGLDGRDFLVISEDLYSEDPEPVPAAKTVILGAGGEGKGPLHVDKYQSAEGVSRKILEAFAGNEEGTEASRFVGTRRKAKIIGIYSPVHRCLKTTFALTLGQMLAEKGRTLYLNFESYVGIQELATQVQDKDLSDMLYFLTSEEPYFRLRFGSVVRRIGELEYIPPMKASQNLLSITTDEWICFLGKIRKLEMYSYILLDLSESMQGLFEILRRCSRVYTLTREDRLSRAKLMQYEELLGMYAYGDILDKTKKIGAPRIMHLSAEVSEYTRGDFADFVREKARDLLE